MDEYDPLWRYSTALSLLPRTLANVGFSLPVGLSEVDEMKAFFDHMHHVLTDKKSGTKSLEKYPSPNSNTTVKEKDKASEGQRQDHKLASVEPKDKKSGTKSREKYPGPNPITIVKEQDEAFEEQRQDFKLASLEPKGQPNTNSCGTGLSLNPNSLQTKRREIRNCSRGQEWGVEPMELQAQPSFKGHENKLSSNNNKIVAEKDETENRSSVGKNVETNVESIDFTVLNHISDPDTFYKKAYELEDAVAEIEMLGGTPKIIGERVYKAVENHQPRRRRPGLGIDYNLSPFTLVQKSEKTKQVVPVDFTVLDHISDPDAFYKKAYELEDAVTAIERMGGESKIIGERAFKEVEDDEPRGRRPGLGLQLEHEFVLLPMPPLPFKFPLACPCQNRAPTQSISCLETTKAQPLSGSQNEALLSISNATKEAPEMYLCSSSSLERLLSVLESCPEDDDDKAMAMVSEFLNLKPTVIPPLVIPEMPKFSRLHAVRSPWQVPSIERLRESRGEDPLVVFEELKRNFFSSSPTAYCSDDDDTNSPVGSNSPSCHISSENEEFDTPSHSGPSGRPSAIEDSHEKAFEMTSEARGGNDFAGNGTPEETQMGSPGDNSPSAEVPVSTMPLEETQMGSPGDNSPPTEVPFSTMPLENLPVNTEVPSSDMLLETQVEEEMILKEASRRKGNKRGLDHGDSSFDMYSEIPSLTSHDNNEILTDHDIVEPPREKDEQIAPPKKRNKKQQKSARNSIQIVEGGLQEVNGLRRSTRTRYRPLRSWMGEKILYAHINENLPTAVGVKECSPATVGMRVKVKSFMSDEHADLIAKLAK